MVDFFDDVRRDMVFIQQEYRQLKTAHDEQKRQIEEQKKEIHLLRQCLLHMAEPKAIKCAKH